jgi:hypothetical protein
MNIPGITMSPSPSMAKFLAASPFSRISCGKTTAKIFKNDFCTIKHKKSITFDWGFKALGHSDHYISTKDPEDVIEK